MHRSIQTKESPAAHGRNRHSSSRPLRRVLRGSQSLAHCRVRHARHFYGGVGHRHRLGRPPLHRRLPLRHHRRGHLGAHQLPRRQRHRPARQQLVLPQIRPQALPHVVRRHLHRRQLRLRLSAHTRLYPHRTHRSGSRRRCPSAALPGHHARILPAGKARRGHGPLRLRSRRRPCPRPHPRRMAHRLLLMAICLLHQHPRRHLRPLHDQPLRPRSQLHQERTRPRIR